MSDFKAMTAPRAPANIMALLHEALLAWGDDLDGAIALSEACPDETNATLTAMLKLVRDRRRTGVGIWSRRRKG